MMRHLVLITTLLVSANAAAQAAPATDAEVAAIAMPEPQLRMFLMQTVFTTQTIQMAMASVGIEANCALLRPAFEEAFAAALPAWRANLIGAYRQNVPEDVLAKAVKAGPQAAMAQLAPFRDAIGATMRVSSEAVLKTAAKAALQPSMDAAMKVDMKNVDMAARRAEAVQARADGSMLCGLR